MDENEQRYVRDYVDSYALTYYKTTGEDVLVIGELLEDGKMDFKLLLNPNK